MIEYKTNVPISVEQFTELLNKTSLGARRPLEDKKRVAAMLHHADLLVTAWDGARLVGVARSVTDFAYCCYLSDLAVFEMRICPLSGCLAITARFSSAKSV